jgi:hypothetical protein
MNINIVKPRKEFGKTIAADIAHRLRSDIVSCALKPNESLSVHLANRGRISRPQSQRGFRVALFVEHLLDLTPKCAC